MGVHITGKVNFRSDNFVLHLDSFFLPTVDSAEFFGQSFESRVKNDINHLILLIKALKRLELSPTQYTVHLGLSFGQNQINGVSICQFKVNPMLVKRLLAIEVVEELLRVCDCPIHRRQHLLILRLRLLKFLLKKLVVRMMQIV